MSEFSEGMVEAAIRAAYNDRPQWRTLREQRVSETFEECYGCAPLDHEDWVRDVKVILKAALAAAPDYRASVDELKRLAEDSSSEIALVREFADGGVWVEGRLDAILGAVAKGDA